MTDGVKCAPYGVRSDVSGNLWVSSNAGRHVGYSGVTVWTPSGQLIGRIRLPEVCANICFGDGSLSAAHLRLNQERLCLCARELTSSWPRANPIQFQNYVSTTVEHVGFGSGILGHERARPCGGAVCREEQSLAPDLVGKGLNWRSFDA